MKNSVNSIGTWISVLYRYRKSFIIKKFEGYGVLGGLYMVVMVINYYNGTSQEQISEILKTDKASIARSIKKLEKEGYVTREPDKADKRANKVYLTPKAQALVPEIQKVINEWESLIVANIPKDAFRLIEQYMEQMAKDAYTIYTSYAEAN